MNIGVLILKKNFFSFEEDAGRSRKRRRGIFYVDGCR